MRNSKPPLLRQPPYPYAEWFERDKFCLRKGTHYVCDSWIMSQMLRNYVSRDIRRKVPKLSVNKISVAVTADKVLVTVTGRWLNR